MFDLIEKGLYWFSSFGLRSDVDAFCQIDHTLNNTTFVTTTGSLLTFFNVVGSQRYCGPAEFESQSAALAQELAVLLNAGYGGAQHSLVFGFRQDRFNGRAAVRDTLAPSVQTARRFRADADWLFTDRLNAMATRVVDELTVFGVMTHPAGMSPAERKRAQEDAVRRYAQLAKSGASLSPHTQVSRLSPPALMVSRHEAAISSIEDKISNPRSSVRVMLERMDCALVGRMMRRFLEAGEVPANWRAVTTSTLTPYQGGNVRRGDDAPMIFPKRWSRQLITEKITMRYGDAEMAKRGKYYFASLAMEIAPQAGDEINATPSFNLLAEPLGKAIPWQVHFDVSPNGLDYRKVEQAFASIFGAAGDHNKAIKAGWDDLKELKKQGECIAALRAIFTTWAETERECVDRLAYLRSTIEAWAQTAVTNELANPAEALMASAPGFCSTLPAEPLPGPLPAYVRMMPMFRVSSIWSDGQLVCHTPEGRPYPIKLGSPEQNYWGTLVFAPTGSGKSTLMNMLNSGALFSPGLTELPMITVIDKGPSALGMVRLAQAMLPPDLASQVVYLRPTANDSSFVVNPCDTQLGCEAPLPGDKEFLCALLLAMAPNLGAEGGKFVNKVVEVLYDYYGRRSPTAKRWELTMNPELSDKLPHVGIQFDENQRPRVWTVVDAFFSAGLVAEAQEAQLYAVPTLFDISTVLGSDPRVRSEYGNARLATGELIIDVFTRNIGAALSQYRLFAGITKFRGGEQRVMVIDTEGLAASSASEEGRRLYGITLLFARRLGAKNFFLHEKDMEDISPPLYAQYHRTRAQKIRSELKFLEYDEIHNARGITDVVELLQKDAREGRKYNTVTVLSSQELEDFPLTLVNNSYNFFILGAGTGSSVREIQATFNLSDSEARAIERECTSPGKFFGMFKTSSRGTLSQILHTRAGPVELWAFSTTASDTPIRDDLYARYGVKNALLFLAREFPGGSARQYIQDVRMSMREETSDSGITAMVLSRLYPKADKFIAGLKSN